MDILFVALICGFFGLAVLFVRLCDSIVGADTASTDETTAPVEEEEVAAS
jgi:hypothetical protein